MAAGNKQAAVQRAGLSRVNSVLAPQCPEQPLLVATLKPLPNIRKIALADVENPVACGMEIRIQAHIFRPALIQEVWIKKCPIDFD